MVAFRQNLQKLLVYHRIQPIADQGDYGKRHCLSEMPLQSWGEHNAARMRIENSSA